MSARDLCPLPQNIVVVIASQDGLDKLGQPVQVVIIKVKISGVIYYWLYQSCDSPKKKTQQNNKTCNDLMVSVTHHHVAKFRSLLKHTRGESNSYLGEIIYIIW